MKRYGVPFLKLVETRQGTRFMGLRYVFFGIGAFLTYLSDESLPIVIAGAVCFVLFVVDQFVQAPSPGELQAIRKRELLETLESGENLGIEDAREIIRRARIYGDIPSEFQKRVDYYEGMDEAS